MSVSEPLESKEGNANKGVAVYIAVLAVLLAINSIGGGNTSKIIMTSSIQAADTYAFFQAKNIRQTSLKLAADALDIKLMEPGLSEEARKAIRDKSAAYRAKAARYQSEPETGDGKKELLQKAKKLEVERDYALKRDPYFDYSGGLLQIAIVLASVSMILGGAFLLWSSIGLGILGTAILMNAFTLAVEFPLIG